MVGATLVIGAALVIGATLLVGACRNGQRVGDGGAAALPAEREAAEAVVVRDESAALPALTVHPSGGPAVALRVELAVRPSERERGLMFRESLAADRGMLFVFEQEGDYPFYMRNTYVPLDLLYIDAAGRVVGVLEDMRPLDETPRSVGLPARYVLEVNAGSARRWGVQAGDRVDLPTP